MIWGVFPYFLETAFGEMIQFDEHIFQMGWFNHQLVTGYRRVDMEFFFTNHTCLILPDWSCFGIPTDLVDLDFPDTADNPPPFLVVTCCKPSKLYRSGKQFKPPSPPLPEKNFRWRFTLLKTNSSHLKIGRAPKGNSSSNHPFSEDKLLVSGRVLCAIQVSFTSPNYLCLIKAKNFGGGGDPTLGWPANVTIKNLHLLGCHCCQCGQAFCQLGRFHAKPECLCQGDRVETYTR